LSDISKFPVAAAQDALLNSAYLQHANLSNDAYLDQMRAESGSVRAYLGEADGDFQSTVGKSIPSLIGFDLGDLDGDGTAPMLRSKAKALA